MQFYGCYVEHAGEDCAYLDYNCFGRQFDAGKCEQCGPPDASPKPGDACLAAQEGEKRCYYCDTVIECRFADGYFLWRVLEECYPATCTEDADGAHC